MRITFYTSFIILFIKIIIEETSLLSSEKLSNNDFTSESVNFIETPVLDVKSSTLQKRERRQFTFISRFISNYFILSSLSLTIRKFKLFSFSSFFFSSL